MSVGTTPESATQANVEQVVPFFSVSNIGVSVRFYVDGLGFQMTKKWVASDVLRWCWLQLGGAAVMLQEFRKVGHDSWVPEGKVGEGMSIWFQCRDSLVIYRDAKSRGIEASEPFVGNGRWDVKISDPMDTGCTLRARPMRRKSSRCRSGKAERAALEANALTSSLRERLAHRGYTE